MNILGKILIAAIPVIIELMFKHKGGTKWT